MPSMRAYRSAVALGVFIAATLILVAEANAKIYGLVVGIDDYAHITPLSGAVNDAVDIADALNSLPGAEVEVLINREATREAFISKWREIAARSRPGDAIIVTFAGHGSYEPAAIIGDEEDGRDETLLFAEFTFDGPGAGERVRDNEIAELIAAAPNATTLVVFDSCHSGTATRTTAHDLTYRYYDNKGIVDDPLPPPPVAPPGGANTVFFGAVPDSEKAAEIYIDGDVRGALSYAFASGIRGEADHNGDGVISKGELEVHVRKSVKAKTAGRQKPQVEPVGASELSLASLVGQVGQAQKLFELTFDELPRVNVHFIKGEGILPRGSVSGAEFTDTVAHARLVVDISSREIRSVLGDVERYLTARDVENLIPVLQAIVDKTRFVEAVLDASTMSKIDVRFPFGDELYFSDDPLTLLIDGRESEFTTLFNIPSNGRVEWLYPRNPSLDPGTPFRHPMQLPAEKLIRLDVIVNPPFGADHLIAIETETDIPAVRRAVRRHHGLSNIRPLWADLRAALGDAKYSVAAHPFFTSGE